MDYNPPKFQRRRQASMQLDFSWIIAMILSYSVNESIWWCILHTFIHPIYVVYWFIVYSPMIEWVNIYLRGLNGS